MPALIRNFLDKVPQIGARVFLAETAVVVGDVQLAEDVNIWFGTVLRGDVGAIRIGARSNIQDLTMVHMTHGLSTAEIGEDVTVGHSAVIHGAKVGRGALIGMGSILLDNAEIGERALVGAGSLVSAGSKVPPGTLVLGRPAKVVRELSKEELDQGGFLAARYLELARQHIASLGR